MLLYSKNVGTHCEYEIHIISSDFIWYFWMREQHDALCIHKYIFYTRIIYFIECKCSIACIVSHPNTHGILWNGNFLIMKWFAQKKEEISKTINVWNVWLCHISHRLSFFWWIIKHARVPKSVFVWLGTLTALLLLLPHNDDDSKCSECFGSFTAQWIIAEKFARTL